MLGLSQKLCLGEEAKGWRGGEGVERRRREGRTQRQQIRSALYDGILLNPSLPSVLSDAQKPARG